jgi:hypothetical protein
MRRVDFFDRGAPLKVLKKILRELCWAGRERKI